MVFQQTHDGPDARQRPAGAGPEPEHRARIDGDQGHGQVAVEPGHLLEQPGDVSLGQAALLVDPVGAAEDTDRTVGVDMDVGEGEADEHDGTIGMGGTPIGFARWAQLCRPTGMDRSADGRGIERGDRAAEMKKAAEVTLGGFQSNYSLVRFYPRPQVIDPITSNGPPQSAATTARIELRSVWVMNNMAAPR